jgi:hypothetical protein
VVEVGRLVADAIAPFEPPSMHERSVENIFQQLYSFTYPFWMVQYRRVQSWRYAVGVCLGLRPRNSLAGLALQRSTRVRLSLLFWTASLVALAIPERIFARLHRTLYRFAKAEQVANMSL